MIGLDFVFSIYVGYVIENMVEYRILWKQGCSFSGKFYLMIYDICVYVILYVVIDCFWFIYSVSYDMFINID